MPIDKTCSATQDSDEKQPLYSILPSLDNRERDEAGKAIMQILSNQNFTAFQAKVILNDVERAIEFKAKL